MSVGVVVNPVAGSRMSRNWVAIRIALERHFEALRVEVTRQAGDASRLAEELARSGASLVIAVGGDGTVSEVADGLLRAGVGGAVAELGIVPSGTGSDFARGLGVGGGVDVIAERIATRPGRLIDAGRVEFLTDAGAPSSRHFINIASLGLSGPTDRAVNSAKSSGQVSGRAVFLWHTVRELIRYRFQEVRVTVDGGVPVEGRIALVAIANGRYFGGGMMIAPGALPDDGLAEIVIVMGTSKFALLKDLRLVYSGAHRGLSSCTFLRGKTVVVEPLGDPDANAALLDIDGESPGRIPATFEIFPSAIAVRC